MPLLRAILAFEIQSRWLPQLRISPRPNGKEGTSLLMEKDFNKAVTDLKAQLQRRREIRRDKIHMALIIALHTDSLWEKP